MNCKLKFIVCALAICCVATSTGLALLANASFTTENASITTDKTKYSVGETMAISGTGFSSNASVTISVLKPDHTTEIPFLASTDGAGAFQASYTPSDPALPGRYKITATDGVNTAMTASTEADAIGFDLKQCAQDDSAQGQPLGLGFCNWIGSALNNNNAHLFEGIATEQQLIVTGMSGTSHTMVVGIQATKSQGGRVFTPMTFWFPMPKSRPAGTGRLTAP